MLREFKEIDNSVDKVRKFVKKNFLIEEFLEGDQVSTESIIYKNKIYTPGIVDRKYSDTIKFLPQVLENGATVPTKNFKYIKKN